MGHREASIFHTAAWARVLVETYQFNPCYFIQREASRISTIIPAMEVDSFLTGRRGVSLPFTDRCEILGDSTPRKQFLQALAAAPTSLLNSGSAVSPVWCLIKEVAQDREWKSFETRDGELLPGVGPSQTYCEHVLDLSGGEKKLQSLQNPATRRAIQKAGRSGLKIEVSSSLKATQEYYQLHCQTRQKQGVPPQPWHFFENICRFVLQAGSGFVITAREGSRAVAAAVFFHFGRHALYKFGSSDPAYLALRGNNLVMWEAIRRFASDGFETLNFGRTSLLNPGLRRFKEGWGAEERPIGYTRFDFRTSRFCSDSNQETGWHTSLFRKVPLPLARLAGRVLYRHMA